MDISMHIVFGMCLQVRIARMCGVRHVSGDQFVFGRMNAVSGVVVGGIRVSGISA